MHMIVTAHNMKEDEKETYWGAVERLLDDMTHVQHVSDLYVTVHDNSLPFEEKFVIWQQIKFCCEQIVFNNNVVLEKMLVVMSSV